MARTKKTRRRAHGSAWLWKQTNCWYYTLPGTKRRLPLFDDQGERIRGAENQALAERALAKLQVAGFEGGEAIPDNQEWLVARACSEYLESCERRLAAGQISVSHRNGAVNFLNELCRYAGQMPMRELKKSHIQDWFDSHPSWRSPATRRGILTIVQAAFNRMEERHGVPNPLKGMKKPPARPRLQSFSEEEEAAVYGATEECFRNFLFAAIHTGLRPFCELAQLRAEDVESTERGMMWRVYSSKTKKTRKIPVPPVVASLVRSLLRTAPLGSGKPLFRNTQGEPWQRMTGVVRFLTLKKKLGWNHDPRRRNYSCYTCRHTFVHRMLSGYWTQGIGCSIETVAELIGDTPKVAFEHYGKEWGQHYQEPLWAAIGVGKPASRAGRKKPDTSSRKSPSRPRRVPK